LGRGLSGRPGFGTGRSGAFGIWRFIAPGNRAAVKYAVKKMGIFDRFFNKTTVYIEESGYDNDKSQPEKTAQGLSPHSGLFGRNRAFLRALGLSLCH
jgi:hypothetical protein